MGSGCPSFPPRRLRPVEAAFSALLFFLPLSRPPEARADSATPVAKLGPLRKKIHEHKEDLAAIEQRLKAEKRMQSQAEAREKNVLDRLEKLDRALGRLQSEKQSNEEDLGETRDRLDSLRSDMAQNQAQWERSRQLLKRRLRDLYRMSFRQPFLGGLLDSESFSDLARKLKFETALAEGNEQLLSRTRDQQDRLQKASRQWNDEEHRKQRILSALGRQEANYSHERQNRKGFLASIRRQKEVREKTIQELSQAAQNLQAKISSFLQQAKEAQARQAPFVPAGRGLRVERGSIPWPVSGEIISTFGKHRNKEFNAVVDNSGIQIRAPQGTPFRAVAAGLVRFADWFKGYGKLVILDHGGGYYSLYAQAAELDVSEGQKVAAGQVLGTVGDTGSLVGDSLYFEIRKNGVPQDPQKWLRGRP
jgi:murein hydrolase activator